MAEVVNKSRGNRKVRKGDVVSKSGKKSIKVAVELKKPHPFWGKVITSYRNFHVHDEKDEAVVGDVVTIEETRPISKLKRWRLVEVLKKTEK